MHQAQLSMAFNFQSQNHCERLGHMAYVPSYKLYMSAMCHTPLLTSRDTFSCAISGLFPAISRHMRSSLKASLGGRYNEVEVAMERCTSSSLYGASAPRSERLEGKGRHLRHNICLSGYGLKGSFSRQQLMAEFFVGHAYWPYSII